MNSGTLYPDLPMTLLPANLSTITRNWLYSEIMELGSSEPGLRAQWLFPVIVCLHNLEEAIWLPLFWQRRGWHVLTSGEFRVVAAAIAALAVLVTYRSTCDGPNSLGARLFVAFCLLMLLNAVWHLAASIYLKAYAPGVVTAGFLVFPVTSYLLVRAWRSRYGSCNFRRTDKRK
ncbi:MAG: HXXEE domain-containing protein [Acidobacteria bacterium]|nr:HXXEE domain-containing protein [Acidobacteriota bacterium]